VKSPRLLATTVVGSYPQPDWLVDRATMAERLPPRVRAEEVWRVDGEYLEQAQDDATVVAVHAMVRAGVDIVTDGEARRESYSNRFATALEGLDLDNPGVFVERIGKENFVPRVVGPVRRSRPVQARDVEFLRRVTDRPIKITVPGPFTLTQQTQNEFYADERSLALDFAAAVNEEIGDLFAAGADIVQIDEPYLQARPKQAREYALDAISRALAGAAGTTALHTCFGYAHFAVQEKSSWSGYPFLDELNEVAVDQLVIEAAQPRLDLSLLRRIRDKTVVLGVVDLGDAEVESVGTVAARIRAALEHIEPARLMVAPDCGMKYLSRDVAFGKLRAMVDGAAMVRAEL
jgi:5-methyltetrahydropteroyltriglutamate--homocysteine methyltransferase